MFIHKQYDTSESGIGKGYPQACDSLIGTSQPHEHKCHTAFRPSSTTD